MCGTKDNILPVNLKNHEAKEQHPMRILFCSESVPPQVNGIARRVGHYVEGLSKLGCQVDLLCPESKGVWSYVNPWNFTAAMMMISPGYFFQLLAEDYDVVHVVMPMNFSGMWLLVGYKLLRWINQTNKPALVVSWHCNLMDYFDCHFPTLCKFFEWIFFGVLMSILPKISDCILTPTKATEKVLTQKYTQQGKYNRTGVCYTGLSKKNFNPNVKDSECGKTWQTRKAQFLKENNCKHLILCVGRLSPEKGVEELINCMPMLDDCALWLVGDGPDRPKYEALAKQLNVPVKFWGYQKGEALHSVYTMADLFVCPSTTETFGQTVNEAIASEVRVALPSVKVFQEAFSEYIPNDAFWEPLNRPQMVHAIKLQLKRFDEQSEIGQPDASKLRSWDDACVELRKDYELAEGIANSYGKNDGLTILTMMALPSWFSITIFAANSIYILSLIRMSLGGMSLRYVIKNIFSNTNQFLFSACK